MFGLRKKREYFPHGSNEDLRFWLREVLSPASAADGDDAKTHTIAKRKRRGNSSGNNTNNKTEGEDEKNREVRKFFALGRQALLVKLLILFLCYFICSYYFWLAVYIKDI